MSNLTADEKRDLWMGSKGRPFEYADLFRTAIRARFCGDGFMYQFGEDVMGGRLHFWVEVVSTDHVCKLESGGISPRRAVVEGFGLDELVLSLSHEDDQSKDSNRSLAFEPDVVGTTVVEMARFLSGEVAA